LDIANYNKVKHFATRRLLTETTFMQAFDNGECQKTEP